MHNELSPHEKTWAEVTRLLGRWRLSVVGRNDGTWDVHAPGGTPARRRVWWRDLPQAITDVAARCEAAAKREGEGKA